MMLFSVLLLCVVGMVCGQDGTADKGEYGHYSTWRKAICEKNDQEMYKEMDTCFSMERKVVADATAKCINEAMDSEDEDDTIAFINASCKDVQLFHKFDTCFDEYTTDPDFQLQLEVTSEIVKCYKDVIEKYSMDSLKDYFYFKDVVE